MKQYLQYLEPEEVVDRMNKGERVYYEDSRGKKFSYRIYKGITIRYNEDGEVDGYNRSIYSTGEAYFDVKDALQVKSNHHYKTRNGKIVYITKQYGKWFTGFIFSVTGKIEQCWLADGRFFEDDVNDSDLVEELD